ncbi:MAG: ABC transporter substrate-binding protein [Sulfuritalea sp.]|nr:ABC transporter substrate-binding protein [Sulfuritalea sp.]
MAAVLHSGRFRASATAVVVIILGLAYLSTRGPPPKPTSPVEKLRIALPELPHTALVHIAAAKGYFAEEGLDVSIRPVNYGALAIDDVLQEKADLAVTAEVPFVIAVMKGNALGMVASLASLSNDNAIIARRDRSIAAAGDLAGRKIGVSFGTSGSYFLWAFLIRHKLPLPPDSIELVDLPPDQIVEALAKGSVDAVATWQPISLLAQTALGKNAVSFSESEAYRTTMIAFGRSEFLKGHAAAMEKLIRALLKAEQFMQSHPEEALKLVAQWLKTDVDALRPTWQQFDFSVTLLQSHLITLEDEARWAMARGYVALGPVPNLLPHLYLDALLAVQPERVTVLH